MDLFRNGTAAADASPSRRAATLIVKYREDICRRWLQSVRSHIPMARDYGDVEVLDHLLDLLNDIVHTLELLEEGGDPADADDIPFIGMSSALHGRERATLEDFTVGNVVQEYILLRHIITGCCRRDHPDDARTTDIINRVIEAASLNAVNEFVRSIQEIQHKLIATLVHDVRTPLGVAHNYVELLSLAQLSDEERAQAVNTATRSLRRSVAMLEQLLDATRLRAGGGLLLRFEEVDLNATLRTVCTEARLIYDVVIEADLESRPVMGIFDPGMVIRTVENLLSNAVKFGRLDRPIRLSLSDLGDAVEIRVHNEGDAIAADQQEDIFRFFSSHRSPPAGRHKAWGLGLALIRSVAESHGGSVILESSAEQGTTFGMRLGKSHRRAGEEQTVLL